MQTLLLFCQNDCFYTIRHLLIKDMNSQVNFLFDFKRFKRGTADVAKTREVRHEEGTKHATKWAVNEMSAVCSAVGSSGPVQQPAQFVVYKDSAA